MDGEGDDKASSSSASEEQNATTDCEDVDTGKTVPRPLDKTYEANTVYCNAATLTFVSFAGPYTIVNTVSNFV